MLATAFAPQLNLRSSSRMTVISRTAGITATELICLFACGGLAAVAVGFLHLSFRVPGHAILRGALPMALGLALVPRRLAGIVMSIGAGITSIAMSFGHVGVFPPTAMLSVLALGPILDVAMHGQSKGWRLYARFIVAGAMANLLAFGLKMAGVTLAIEAVRGGGLFQSFGSVAAVSYALCGALAGLIGAAVWFRIRVDDDLRRN
ncbi:MAG TPA: hypothetical protein VFW73_04525 [Lacipirellulaceae bacterium]|nr:hypothetical protein [Lacipirellulaceae bacterium]